MKNTTDSTLAQIPKNLTVNGFRYGLRQPSQVVSFTFGIIPAIDTEKMDDWLRENFEIDVAPYHGFDFSKSSQDIVHLAQFVWRVNHLANSLLQALRVPSFDPGCILSIEPEASIPHVQNHCSYHSSIMCIQHSQPHLKKPHRH